jgi:hypothetical protein
MRTNGAACGGAADFGWEGSGARLGATGAEDAPAGGEDSSFTAGCDSLLQVDGVSMDLG